jgi:type I restriction enzyme, R subunit
LSKGILETIDMDSYRVEKKAAIKIQLPDQDVEIEPVPLDAVVGRADAHNQRREVLLPERLCLRTTRRV